MGVLILLRVASRLGESTGLWVDTLLWQRLLQPVSEYTHTPSLLVRDRHTVLSRLLVYDTNEGKIL